MKSTPVLLMFLVGILFLVILAIISFVKETTLMPLLCVAPLIIIGFFICPIIFYYQQKKAYNNGICPKCGGPLKYFDSDSGGSSGYCCEKCHKYYIWIDWFTPDEEK